MAQESQPAVLVVDDEQVVLDLVRESLAPLFDITTASSGEQAIAALRAREFAVLLADQRMPGMSGVALAARAREMQPHIVSILLSAYTDPQDIIAAINHGQVFRFISKPWELHDLTLTVQQAAERHRLSRDNARLVTELARRLKALEVVHAAVASAGQDAHQHPAGVILDRLREVVPYDLAAVLLAPRGGEPPTLQLKSSGPTSQENVLELRDRAIALFEFLAGASVDENRLRTEAGLSVADVPPRPIESQVQLPLLRGDGIVGVLLLQSHAPGAFAGDTAKLLDLLANGTAEALARIQEAAHGEWRLLEQTLASLPDGILLTDSAGSVLLANPAAQRLLAARAGTSLWALLGLTSEEPAVDSPGVRGREIVVGPHTVELALRRSETDDAMRSRIVATVRDLTLEKDREAQRRRFISTISHEIRTPLSSIVATVELLLHGLAGELTDKQRQYLTAASGACESLHVVVDDLLDIEKYAAGAIVMRPRPLPLDGLLREAVSRYRAAAVENELDIAVEGAGAPGQAVVDPVRLEQVCGNLLSNAIKYAKARSVITARVGTAAALGGWAVLGVHNEGEPIAPADLAHIFDRFSRPLATTTRRGAHSSGLGLAICRAIVLAHGGALFAESGAAGTTVWAALPTVTSTAASAPLEIGTPVWVWAADAYERVAIAATLCSRGLAARLLPSDAAEAQQARAAVGAGIIVRPPGPTAPTECDGAVIPLETASLDGVGGIAEALMKLARHAPRAILFAGEPTPALRQVVTALGLQVEVSGCEEAVAVAAGTPAAGVAQSLIAVAETLSGKVGTRGRVCSFLRRARAAQLTHMLACVVRDWDAFVAAYGPSRGGQLREAIGQELAARVAEQPPGSTMRVLADRGALIAGGESSLLPLARELPAAFAALARLHCRREDRLQGFIQLGSQRVALPSLACRVVSLASSDAELLAAIGMPP